MQPAAYLYSTSLCHSPQLYTFAHHTIALAMKYFLNILATAFFSLSAFAQPDKYLGLWEGDLNAGVQTIRFVFSFTPTDNAVGIKLSIQAPQQSPLYIPTDTLIIQEDNSIFTEKKQFKMSFKGKLVNDSTLSGEFTQGAAFPLLLKKVEKASVIEKTKRPQTPRPPYSYKSIEVNFTNQTNTIRFGGTLTLPDTLTAQKYPAVILITGSGPQDRDETILGHKPFAVIADYLTKNGWAVLRVDDRGVGKTTGNHATATSADFADDKEAALNWLQKNKWIDAKRIGLIGHSEGGMIAPLLAARRKDIKAIVLLAGPGVKGFDLMTEQNIAIYEANGLSKADAEAYGAMYKELTKAIIDAGDKEAAISAAVAVLDNWNASEPLRKTFNVYTPEEKTAFAKAMTAEIYNDWFRYFFNYNPAPALKKLSCNVLALNGSKDIQVLPHSNLEGIKAALKKSKSKSYEVKEIPGLNHLFQTCKSCTLNEYGTLEESFSPVVLGQLNEWLQKNL